jgi:hypothetical protein
VAVAASFVAIGLAAIYWTARIGFANPVEPVAGALAVALFIMNAPYVARMIAGRVGERYEWWQSYSFFWILSLLVAAAAGRIAAAAEVSLLAPVGIAGIIVFVVTVVDWAQRARWWRSLVVVLGSLAFSTFAGGVVWGRIYKSPLFTEMLEANGIVHHDPLGLIALANMLSTYHVPGVGLDGLPGMKYHWGSMWIFAQLAELTGSSALDFYNLGYVLIMLPFFFGAVVCFAVELQRASASQGGEFSDFRNRLPLLTIFLVAFIGVLPITGMDSMGVWTSNLMISESYSIGMGAMLLLAGVTVTWYSGRASGVASADWFFPAVVLPVGIIGLGYLKISMMILGFLAVMYAAYRLRFFRQPGYIVVAVLFTAVFLWTLTLVSLPQHREGFHPFDFLKGFVPPAWWPFFVIAQLFWSVLYIVMRVRSMGLRTFSDLRDAMSDRRTVDIEIVALIAGVGIIPGFVTHIDGGSAFYFSDIQRWMSVALIMGLLASGPVARRKERSLFSLRTVLILFLAFPLIWSMGSNSVFWTKRMLAANAALRYEIYPDSLSAKIPPGIRGLPRLRDERVLQAGLEQSPNFLPAAGLMELAARPRAERARTALFIPQSERRYWEMLKRPGACSFASHVAPALASMMMIDGMPAYGCELSKYYGLGFHRKRDREQVAADTLPSTLCRKARPWGITRVVTVHFDESGRAKPRVDECQRAQ